MLTLNDIVVERGNTVRFHVKFSDFNGFPIDPDSVLFKVYDRRFNLLSEENMEKVVPVEVEEEEPDTDDCGCPRPKEEVDYTGQYYAFFTPEEDGDFTVELYGLIDNKPSLVRRKVRVVFDDTRI